MHTWRDLAVKKMAPTATFCKDLTEMRADTKIAALPVWP